MQHTSDNYDEIAKRRNDGEPDPTPACPVRPHTWHTVNWTNGEWHTRCVGNHRRSGYAHNNLCDMGQNIGHCESVYSQVRSGELRHGKWTTRVKPSPLPNRTRNAA